ncbi:MAG TPA: sialidase family protein [Gaiellaceae bacterium]|nr:sialidase family protein [Gaiellaceae bacterium]
MKSWSLVGALALAFGLLVGVAAASTPGGDVKLTHDANDPGYVSSYTLATGTAYTDTTLQECSRSRGRQNEPAIAVDPRNTDVILGSSNDYCGVYNAVDADGNPSPVGPIWLGYYRSENAGGRFVSSLVPGYPDDTSPYGQIAKQQVRTASSGDPVIAWDAQGRAFFGSESSDDPAGTPKTFGDVWVATYDNPDGPGGATVNDGKRYRQTVLVARGSSAPNLLGVFNDKTTIEADHNSDGSCDNNAYFAWTRFSGAAGGVGVYFSRSTDHGATFSHGKKVSQTISDVQFPDIAVTGNSHVYLVFRSFASGRGSEGNSVYYVKSTDCGQTFSRPKLLQNFVPNDAQDVADPEEAPPQSRPDDPGFEEEPTEAGDARDCGDFDAHCESGYTFFRRDTQPRATADQFDTANPDRFYVVYDATKPGTVTDTGSTYGTIESGTAGQAGIFFLRVNGANGSKTDPSLIDNQAAGHQVFPDISADNPDMGSRGTLHAIWWDSRNDACYSVTRPIGNCADRSTVPSLDAWAASSSNFGTSWSSTRVSDVTTNPNYEQFADRTVPFAGDYLYVSSVNDFSYGVWTDWRDTVQGPDPREGAGDEDGSSADVHQCRTQTDGVWSTDTCPRAGGLDQNIYGDLTP